MAWWHCFCCLCCFQLQEKKEKPFQYRQFSQHSYEERLAKKIKPEECVIVDLEGIKQWRQGVLKESPTNPLDLEPAFFEENISQPNDVQYLKLGAAARLLAQSENNKNN